jgi:hypothetical protein
MLIRIDTGEFREFPDELAALILADPSCGDEYPDFSPNEVNILIHGVLGTYYEPSKSFEENITKVRKLYSSIGKPDDENYYIACKAISRYNQEIHENEIGLVDKDELFSNSDTYPLTQIKKS